MCQISYHFTLMSNFVVSNVLIQSYVITTIICFNCIYSLFCLVNFYLISDFNVFSDHFFMIFIIKYIYIYIDPQIVLLIFFAKMTCTQTYSYGKRGNQWCPVHSSIALISSVCTKHSGISIINIKSQNIVRIYVHPNVIERYGVNCAPTEIKRFLDTGSAQIN